MRRGAAAAFLVLIASALAASRAPAEPGGFAARGPYAVGVKTVVYVDSTRQDEYAGGPRTLVTEIWYPAADEARGGKPTEFIEFFGDHPEAGKAFVEHFKGKMEEVSARFKSVAVRNAPLAKGEFPLLVFSHGNGGLRHQNVFQLDHLASHGYVIASPDHTGNAGVTVLPEKVLSYDKKGRPKSMADRPKDVKLLIDRLLEESKADSGWLKGALDPDEIGVLGHSFGGLTCCQAAELDHRVKAILPMTLAVTKPATIPVLLMLGALDRTVDEAGNVASTAWYMGCTGPKHLLTLKRGGHFSFSDMDRINPSFGDGIGVGKNKDGTEVHYLDSALTKEIINAYSLAFFDGYLRKNAAAREFLGKNSYPAEVDLRSGDSEGKTQ